MNSRTHHSDDTPCNGAGPKCDGHCRCRENPNERFDPGLAAGAAAACILMVAAVLMQVAFSMAGISLAGELLALTRSIGLADPWGALLGISVAWLVPWTLIYLGLRRFVPLYRGKQGLKIEVAR